MKFDHVVNYNGTYYAAGENVPVETETKETETKLEQEQPVKRGRKKSVKE